MNFLKKIQKNELKNLLKLKNNKKFILYKIINIFHLKFCQKNINLLDKNILKNQKIYIKFYKKILRIKKFLL